MKKSLALLIVFLGGIGFFSSQAHADTINEMYRLYNPNSGEHFYTTSQAEEDQLATAGWEKEGTAWLAPEIGDPVYRVYNPNAGDHHYTMNEAEKENLVENGWQDEGIGWYSDTNHGEALLRLYNPNAGAGSHHYTTSNAEKNNLVAIGWQDEGIGWYGVATSSDAASEQQIEETLVSLIDENRQANNLATLNLSEILFEATDQLNQSYITTGTYDTQAVLQSLNYRPGGYVGDEFRTSTEVTYNATPTQMAQEFFDKNPGDFITFAQKNSSDFGLSAKMINRRLYLYMLALS